MAWEVLPKKALTQQQIYDLYEEARRGGGRALELLNEVSSYYGKKSNERLRSFQKAGISSQALKRAEHFLLDQAIFTGKTGKVGLFSRSKKLSAYEAYLNATEARRFYRSKTGTVAKEEKRMSKVISQLQSMELLPEGIESGEERKNLRKFLESNAWEEIKNTLGSQTMRDVGEAINQGANVDELMEAYVRYQKDEIDFEDFIKGWVEM